MRKTIALPWVALCVLGLLFCTNTSTEGGSLASEGPFVDAVNPDAGTVGEDDADDSPAPEGLCADVSPVDEVWTPSPGDFVLRDRQTESLWNVRGQAFAGPCAGAQLEQLPAFTGFWFAWSVSRHEGTIWNQETPNQADAIAPDASSDCLVPCEEIRSGGPPPDGIPALDYLGRWNRPRAQAMVAPDDPDAAYLDDFDIVLGVYRDGQARAYPHALLNWHENHIDALDGVEYNVTYCPLTGSGIVVPAAQGGSGPLYFYVSGRLYNDNLTMFERDTDDPTFWNQMLLTAIRGSRTGERLVHWPVVETTWARWREMHPETLVSSGDTGYSQSLRPNPYSTRQAEDASTLLPVNPGWDDRYPTKARVLVLDGETGSRAYAFSEMNAFGDRVVINDTHDNRPVVVVYEAEHRMAIPYDRRFEGAVLTFDGASAP